MFQYVVQRSCPCWCVLTSLAVRLSSLDCRSPDVVLCPVPCSPLPISSIPFSSSCRITYSQAEWCRDGREKDDLVIRCSWEAVSLGDQPEGGKSHTGSSNPLPESRFMHVLTVLLCALCGLVMACCFSFTGGARRARTAGTARIHTTTR